MHLGFVHEGPAGFHDVVKIPTFPLGGLCLLCLLPSTDPTELLLHTRFSLLSLAPCTYVYYPRGLTSHFISSSLFLTADLTFSVFVRQQALRNCAPAVKGRAATETAITGGQTYVPLLFLCSARICAKNIAGDVGGGTYIQSFRYRIDTD